MNQKDPLSFLLRLISPKASIFISLIYWLFKSLNPCPNSSCYLTFFFSLISSDQCRIKSKPGLAVMDDLCCNLRAQANKYPDCLAGPHGILSNHFPLKLLARKIPIKTSIIKIFCDKLLLVKKNTQKPIEPYSLVCFS